MDGIPAPAGHQDTAKKTPKRTLDKLIDLTDADDNDNPALQSQGQAPPPSSPTTPDLPAPCTPLRSRSHADAPPAKRYRTLAASGLELHNPHRFALNPPFWRRWSAADYALFADALRVQFDPRPFAHARGLPVDEVNAVFHAVVCNPLYEAKTALQRGEEGVMGLMEAVGGFGTQVRGWGRARGRRVKGELEAVEWEREGGEEEGRGKAVVVLVGAKTGNEYRLEVGELSEDDVRYLQGMLPAPEREALGLEEEEVQGEGEGKEGKEMGTGE